VGLLCRQDTTQLSSHPQNQNDGTAQVRQDDQFHQLHDRPQVPSHRLLQQMVVPCPAKILLKSFKTPDLQFHHNNKLAKTGKQITSPNLQSKGNPFLGEIRK
jgi:hypothetical protein